MSEPSDNRAVSGGARRTQRTISVPYSPTDWAFLQASFPMSSQDWNYMLEVLEAMKPGLVTSEVSIEEGEAVEGTHGERPYGGGA